MRIAFYAPMKPPDHPVPSGDRRLARLLIEALAHAGHKVFTASRVRVWQAEPDEAVLNENKKTARLEAADLLRRYRREPRQAPDLWFTYHLYYKAPDWIGPSVAAGLSIPYVVAEASVAHKRATGPWRRGHQAVMRALEQAAAVITFNPIDAQCLPDPGRARLFAPFVDTRRYRAANAHRQATRRRLARQLALKTEHPWLLTVAMMRPGDKLASYRLLAETLERLSAEPWYLILIGGGPAERDVRSAFSRVPGDRLRFIDPMPEDALPPFYAAADLFVWPAINEAFGMSILEAQAAGLPVLAGDGAGVAAIVRSGRTGDLVAPGRLDPFVKALRSLLANPAARAAYGAAALEVTGREHDLAEAARRLDAVIQDVAAHVA